MTPQFIQAAAREVRRTPADLQELLHQETVSSGYELRPLRLADLPVGVYRRARYSELRREMLLILLSVLFGFAVIEITKTLLSLVPWFLVGVQRAKVLLALVILSYFVLNSVRYVWSHVKLSAYTPLVHIGSGWGRLAAFVHDLMFPLQAMLFVAMALILTIPGVPLFSALPPTPIRADVLARYFDTLVAGFVLLNLALATLDLLWCTLMERLLFEAPSSSGHEVCTPPDLAGWRSSSAEEVMLFSLAFVLLLVSARLSLGDWLPGGGIYPLWVVVALPWLTLGKEFVANLKPERKLLSGSRP